MKKKMKRMVALLAATIMVLSMGAITVNAADVQPRASLCPRCSIAMYPVRKVQSTRRVEKSCTHGFVYGTDVWEEQTIATTMTCGRCGLAYSPTYSTSRTLIRCGGYN